MRVGRAAPPRAPGSRPGKTGRARRSEWRALPWREDGSRRIPGRPRWSCTARSSCPVDNSTHSTWAVERAIEVCRRSGGRITGSHVYAARLHDVRFRQLETGPARPVPDSPGDQATAEDPRQADREGPPAHLRTASWTRSSAAATRPAFRSRASSSRGSTTRSSIRRRTGAQGRLPSLIGFDPNIARKYDGGDSVRGDVPHRRERPAHRRGRGAGREAGRHVGRGLRPAGHRRARDRPAAAQPARRGRLARRARHREGHAGRARRRPLEGGRFMVCVDGSAYSYKGMRVALELAREFGAKLYVCSAFDVEYHHAVFDNISTSSPCRPRKSSSSRSRRSCTTTSSTRGCSSSARPTSSARRPWRGSSPMSRSRRRS